MACASQKADLSSLVINCVSPLSQVIRLFDIRKDATTNAHHPQKLVDIITGVPVSFKIALVMPDSRCMTDCVYTSIGIPQTSLYDPHARPIALSRDNKCCSQ